MLNLGESARVKIPLLFFFEENSSSIDINVFCTDKYLQLCLYQCLHHCNYGCGYCTL